MNTDFGDLKILNLFVSKNKGIIFIDFSKSVLYENDKIVSSNFSGTLTFMSPEKISKKPFDRNFLLAFKSDIWSLGVIFYKILLEKYPFESQIIKFLIKDILKKPINLPSNLSVFNKHLLDEMLEREPHLRISSEDLFNKLA